MKNTINITIPIQITLEDFQQHFLEYSWYYRQRFLLLLFIAGWFVTSMIFADRGWVSLLFFPMILPLIVVIIIPRYLRKMYQQNSRFQESMTYFLNEDTIRLKGESFELSLSWKKLYKLGETPNFPLLMHNTKQSHVIPKRFLDALTLQQIRTIAEKNKVVIS